MTKRCAACATGLTLAWLALGCGEAEPAAVPPAPLVVVEAARSIDLVDEIQASGELVAVDEATVGAEVAGRVTEIARDEGELVARDDVLMRIDPERHNLELADARAQLAGATASLDEAKREVERIRLLHASRVMSDAAVDTAEAAHSAAQARAQAARARLGVAERAWRDSEVKAPFDGRVALRHVSRGEYVSIGMPLVELVAVDPIEVEFHLPERDIGRVAQDQPVEVRVAPFPNERFRGRVHMVSPRIDPRLHTLRIKARVENAEGRLKPGLFARVDLGTEQRAGVVVVPERSVLQRADGSIVFVLDGPDRVRRVAVETGMHIDGWIEVQRGLAAGALVVTQGQARLSDGLLVRSSGRPAAAEVSLQEATRTP